MSNGNDTSKEKTGRPGSNPGKRPELPKDAERMKKCAGCGAWMDLRTSYCRRCFGREFLKRPFFVVPARKETLADLAMMNI